MRHSRPQTPSWFRPLRGPNGEEASILALAQATSAHANEIVLRWLDKDCRETSTASYAEFWSRVDGVMRNSLYDVRRGWPVLLCYV